jgi:hypothetical protein
MRCMHTLMAPDEPPNNSTLSGSPPMQRYKLNLKANFETRFSLHRLKG